MLSSWFHPPRSRLFRLWDKLKWRFWGPFSGATADSSLGIPRTDLDAIARIKNVYDREASNYEARQNRAVRARLAMCDEIIVRALGPVQTAVEFGVGPGRLLAKVEANQRIGIDISHEMCKLALHNGLSAVQANQTDTPLSDGCADAVVSGFAAARYSKPEELLPEINRVLGDGGRFGLHLLSGTRLGPEAIFRGAHQQLPLERRKVGWFDVYSVNETRRLFATAGLWITQVRMLHSISEPPYAQTLRSSWFLPFTTHVILTGERLSRRSQRAIDQVRLELEQDGVSSVVIGGLSMVPTLELGERVIVKPQKTLRPGQILLLQSRCGFIVHRLLGTLGGSGGWIVHRGDSQDSKPALSRTWAVLGEVSQ